MADGKIYLLTSINATTRKAPWRVLTNCYTTCAMDRTKNGETTSVLRGTFYIVEREVKAGEVVEIPTFKNRWGVCVLAKSINPEEKPVVVEPVVEAPAVEAAPVAEAPAVEAAPAL